jgi:hypothetical protein
MKQKDEEKQNNKERKEGQIKKDRTATELVTSCHWIVYLMPVVSLPHATGKFTYGTGLFAHTIQAT